MFDTYVARPRAPRTEYVTREVHEHRAPTDASVTLLREMEAAAEAKRISSMQMSGNLFNGVIEVWEEMQDATRWAQAVFDLNGKRHSVKVWVGVLDKPEELLRQLHEKVAQVVASDMLVDMTKGLKNMLGRS